MTWNNINIFLTLEEENRIRQEQLDAALVSACQKNKINNARAVIIEGANINADLQGLTPLMATVENNNYQIAEYLLKVGANPTLLIKDSDVVWFSLNLKRYEFIRLFLKHKQRMNRDKNTGKTILIVATENSDLGAVEVIAPRVNVNEMDKLGNTALHYNMGKLESSADDVAIGKILIACGADTNAGNLDGETPETVAQSSESKVVLDQHMLDLNIPEPEHTKENDSSNVPANNKEPKLQKPKPPQFKI